MQDSVRQKAEEFLKVASLFQLGALPTEQRHPLTYELADLSRNDLGAALDILKKIDCGVVADVMAKAPDLARLETAISETLDAGNRVFFYGCGATGRLSMSIEYIWRWVHRANPAKADRVLGFMSGGDLALVHSIENFEDHPEFGARQLREIGFGKHDLLVSCTEGGETPSVIGATEEATRLSSRKPFFLYSNPDSVLHEQVERSRLVLENDAIEKICLYVGPMSLSGSTRLQSSTALMLGAGSALLRAGGDGAKPDLADLAAFIKDADFSFLKAFIEEESRIYAAGDYLLYETEDHGITVLTDTTERSPTFSLLAFENQNDPARKPCLSYLNIPSARTPLQAWQKILLRDPITIEWDELRAVAGHARLMGFDLSSAAPAQRGALVAPANVHRFSITREGGALVFALNACRHAVDVSSLHPLFEHLFLKMALNMHSTLVMGRMKRFESNVMTWVKPSNNKLIDRSIRYVEYLLHHRGIMDYSYEDICRQLFVEAAKMTPADAVVIMTVESLAKKAKDQPSSQERSA